MNNIASISEKSIAEIAKEAFLLLSSRKSPPTPEAYKAAFYEVAKMELPEEAAETLPISDKEKAVFAILEDFAKQLSYMQNDIADYGHYLLMALKENNFKQYEKTLTEFTSKYLKTTLNQTTAESVSSKGITGELRELLIRTLTFGLTTLLYDAPEMADEAESLGLALKNMQNAQEFEDIEKRLKQLCFKIEMKGATSAEQQELLLRLFRLLLNNIGELIEDDSWLKGQIEIMKQLVSGPIDYKALENTENSLKEIIYKQGLLKHSLNEAKESIKQMMLSFIERLSIMTESTGNYHDHIKEFSEKINNTNNVVELNTLIAGIMEETRAIQTNTFVSLNQMQDAKKQVEKAENKVKDLENQIEQLSDLVHEDWLTGSLNQRGLEDAFEKEADLSEKQGTPLCVALLDLDNFNELNEKHGYLVGDDILTQLVRIAKHILGPANLVARYGGEEFLILLPKTELNDAVLIMQRLQRELTKHFFMHKNEKMLVTFSAGVALHQKGENQETVANRAYQAMNTAKQSGKNKVLAAK